MKYALLLIACAVPLAGCNKQPEVHAHNASVEEVAGKVRAAAGDQALIRPGEWESSTTVEEMSIPGMPAEVQERMKKVMASQQMHSFKTCVTEADVKRPKEDFFAGKNNECRYDRFNMSGGKIDAVMHCGGNDGTQTMTLLGTYGPEKYEIHMQMVHKGGEPAEAMTMKSHVISRRIGECSAAELADRGK